MADNLESYFKKHLSDDTPAKDSWNVPSDDVWDKVLPEIHKKKGLFIPWKYIYIIGALILVGLVVILWPTENNDTQIEQKLSSFSEEYNPVNRNTNTLIVKDQSNSNANMVSDSDIPGESVKPIIPLSPEKPIEKARASNDQKLSDLEKIDENTVTKKVVYVQKEINETGSPLNSNSPQEGNYFSDGSGSQYEPVSKIYKNETDALNSPGASSYGSEKNNSTIEIIHPKSLNNYTLSYKGNTSIIYQNTLNLPLQVQEQKKKSEPINNKGKFGIGASFLPTFTSTYLIGSINNGDLETSNMYLYSNNWGIELKYFLSNRFTLVTGVGQSAVRSWSKSVVDFGYDTSGEHIMETGEKENTSEIPMPTPFGQINTNITYRFPGDQEIPDGELMNSMLETHQEVRYLSIPLGFEYNIMHFSKFNWFAELGVRYNHALKDAASFSSRILHHGHDMEVVAEEMMGHPSFTNYYLDFYLGTGVNYQFSKSFQISGSARYFNSISKVNEQDNVSTHARGFNIKLGITYIF